MASVQQLAKRLESRPTIEIDQAVQVRPFAGSQDVQPWLDLRHRAFANQYGLALELEVVAFLGHYEKKKVASPNGRFSTWLANQAKWNLGRGNGRTKAVVQRGGTVREGDKSWLEG